MTEAVHRHFWQCTLKGLKVISQNISCLGKSFHTRRVCSLCVTHCSNTAAVRKVKASTTFSKLRINCATWNKHKYNVHHQVYISTPSRGFVTAVTDANLEKDLAGVNDKHRLTCDLLSNDVDDRSINDVNNESHKVIHVPVMVEEVLRVLQPKNGQIIVDMTFGAGGHAKEILKVAPNIQYIASDRDPLANSIAMKLAEESSPGQITPILSRFSEIPTHLHHLGIQPGTVDAFFFDLGASSMQFDMPERGFSLSRDGPLDMRMDGDRFPSSPTAADVVNSLSPNDLAHILKKYGEEKKALQIAHAIVEAKYAFGKFTRTKQLADIISTVFQSGAFRQDKLSHHAHLATKSFQALRIFVNNELNEIHNGLLIARHYLKPKGCCAVLSFHSLEDRIVKRHFLDIDIDAESNLSIHDHFRNANVSFDVKMVQEEYMSKLWEPLFKTVKESTEEECKRNPRSRSAKLRAALKL